MEYYLKELIILFIHSTFLRISPFKNDMSVSYQNMIYLKWSYKPEITFLSRPFSDGSLKKFIAYRDATKNIITRKMASKEVLLLCYSIKNKHDH